MVSRSDKIFVQFEVPESEAPLVKRNQEASFKVYGHPNKKFDENIRIRTVAGEGRQLNEADKDKYFIATAEVPASSGKELLRAGMTGRGRISTDYQPLGWWLFSKPLSFLAMEFF